MKPVLQSLLLADHVYSDQATGKKIVAGVFNRVQRMKAPPKPPEGEVPRPVPIPAGGLASTPFVYMAITELRGKTDFILELTDLAENNRPVQGRLHRRLQGSAADGGGPFSHSRIGSAACGGV